MASTDELADALLTDDAIGRQILVVRDRWRDKKAAERTCARTRAAWDDAVGVLREREAALNEERDRLHEMIGGHVVDLDAVDRKATYEVPGDG